MLIFALSFLWSDFSVKVTVFERYVQKFINTDFLCSELGELE